MIQLRLDGYSYAEIATRTGLSRQRIQQIVSPPPYVRQLIVAKFAGLCARCGLIVGKSGHVHHKDGAQEDFNDVDNLELLCRGCHRRAHAGTGDERITRRLKTEGLD